MKHLKLFSLALFFIVGTSQLIAQSEEDNSELLGDHFSLEGALDAFKNASSMEDFEEQLNSEDKSVNNLDLNEDCKIDYIRVEDHREGDVHAIVLQALLSEDEVQDIAVIEIEKTGNETATLQIVGDDYMYGEEIYVEAFEEEGTSTGRGPSDEYTISRVIVNVWLWPSVRYVYRPTYVVYRSPYRWSVYPRVWRPWKPFGRTIFHSKRHHYHNHYRHVTTHRIVKARKIYTPKRKSSTRVVKRSKTVTKVRKTKGGSTVVKQKTKTTKVKKNKNGTVKGKKTKKTTKVKKGKNGKKRKVTKTKKVKKKKGN